MADENKGRRLRAVFKNALTWGGVWGTLGSAVATIFRLNDNIPFGHAVLDGIGMGIRIGVVGALVGAAFSSFISLAYRGKNLREISWLRFGIGGAILAGAFVPAWMETMSVITGGGLVPFHLIDGDILMSTVFGGITAAGTMILAQRDEARNPHTVEHLLNQMEQQSLNAGNAAASAARQRSRSADVR